MRLPPQLISASILFGLVKLLRFWVFFIRSSFKVKFGHLFSVILTSLEIWLFCFKVLFILESSNTNAFILNRRLMLGVMKRAVKRTSMDVDMSTLISKHRHADMACPCQHKLPNARQHLYIIFSNQSNFWFVFGNALQFNFNILFFHSTRIYNEGKLNGQPAAYWFERLFCFFLFAC